MFRFEGQLMPLVREAWLEGFSLGICIASALGLVTLLALAWR